MALSSTLSAPLLHIILFTSLINNQAFAGGFECEELRVEECAFAVSSSGARCVLETNVIKEGSVELECQTSEIVTERFKGKIESAECVEWCGVERKSIGLSSDFLADRDFHKRICAPACYLNCPNIVDLFTKLADGEGVGLEALCETEKRLSRKLIQSAKEELQVEVAAPTSQAFGPLSF